MILIVPDKFKGSLTAQKVSEALEKALRRYLIGGAKQEIVKIPMADGGDGSLEVMEEACAAASLPSSRVIVESFDALMRPVSVPVLLLDGGQTALVESAKVIGLAMLGRYERNPEKATSYGLGVVVARAVALGCSKVIVCLGGTATNDGGEGFLRAIDEAGGIGDCSLVAACDVTNPLLGLEGATMVFAPQKGADMAMLGRLESRMEAFASEKGLDVLAPGGGAAGGLGAALLKLGAQLKPGWNIFSELLGIEEKVASADCIITGEGRFDSQSLGGKVVDGVLNLCKKYGKKPYVVCGQSTLPPKVWKKAGIEDVVSLIEIAPTVEVCFSDAERLLSGGINIIGCDEAGRGCLAGPVFAAAVVLPEGFHHPLLNDSKKLTASQREQLRPIIEREALAWAVASCDNVEIDRMNILNASIEAMHRAVKSLPDLPGEKMVLVDGNRFKPLEKIASHTVVKGDAKVQAIAAASVLAKTHKDEYVKALSLEYPQYGWDRNAAYPTEEHREAIEKFGVTPYHRLSYKLLQ